MLLNALSSVPWTPRGEGGAWGCVGSAFGHVVVTRYSREKGFLGAVRVLEESLERGCKTICGRGCVPCPAPDTLAPEDRFAPQYFYWNPLWRPPDGEEFIVSRGRERKFGMKGSAFMVLPASEVTGNEEASLPSCWGLSMCHRRAQRASQIARTASGTYLSTGFCHERPFLLVKSHQPDST